MISEQYDIPVAIIVYKRLDAVKRSFEAVRKVKPEKLYIISDGPRSEEEAEKVNAVRSYIEEHIDWKCDVHKDYAEKNMGLRYRMPTGMANVFKNEEYAVFIEDDILATENFFEFCRDMLLHYKDDKSVMMVSGSNICSGDESFHGEDICFSCFASIWGWATWRRAFETYDVNIREWPAVRKSGKLKKILTDNAYRHHAYIFDDLQYHWYRTWDYQWTFNVMAHDGLGIVPRCNLVNNIGMGDAEGEHPNDSKEKIDFISNLKREEISLPIKYPEKIERNEEYDLKYQAMSYTEKYGLIKCIKPEIRAAYYEWIYSNIKKMENDKNYFDSVLEEKYKLTDEEMIYNKHDKYRLVTAGEMRRSAWKYIKYRIFN